MIIISKYLVPKGYWGITIFPFIFLKHKDLKAETVLIHHENIHLRQQAEMLIVPFYMFYGLEFVVRFIQYKNWHAAYRNISFEREAFANEFDKGYLKQRPFLHFLKYLRQHDL